MCGDGGSMAIMLNHRSTAGFIGRRLAVFLVVFCHKMGIQIGPKSEVGGPKDLKTYAWLTHWAYAPATCIKL